MGFTLRNIRITSQDLLSNRDNANISEGFEEITEAMSESLADQVPELLKRIDYLRKNKKLSQNNKIEIQRWIDKKNNDLLKLKEAICERKYSYLQTLSQNEQLHLAECHPLWIIDFNLYLDQIQDLIAIHKDESTIIQCFLEANIFRSLKIFYYASDGNTLTINSNKNLKYINCQTPSERRNNALRKNFLNRPKGEYIFLPTREGHEQWIFKGNRWGLDNNILWLDFGKRQSHEGHDS